MKIVALYCLYDDELSILKRSVESIRPFVDEVIFIDGRFQDFPARPEWQSDRSPQELVEYMESVGHYYYFPGRPQHVKRSFCLSAIPDGAWGIVIDADERLTGGGEDLRSALEKVVGGFARVHMRGENYFTRCFRGGVHAVYNNRHDEISWEGGQERVHTLGPKLPAHIRIQNFEEERSLERKTQKQEYYQIKGDA